MDAISRQWRKPTGTPSSKKLAAQNKANARWSSLQNKPKDDSKIINEIFLQVVI